MSLNLVQDILKHASAKRTLRLRGPRTPDSKGDWKERGACVDLDLDLFFVTRGDKVSRIAEDACNRCEVRSECRDWALRHEHHGYWAGTSERERERIRRREGITFVYLSLARDR